MGINNLYAHSKPWLHENCASISYNSLSGLYRILYQLIKGFHHPEASQQQCWSSTEFLFLQIFSATEGLAMETIAEFTDSVAFVVSDIFFGFLVVITLIKKGKQLTVSLS